MSESDDSHPIPEVKSGVGFKHIVITLLIFLLFIPIVYAVFKYQAQNAPIPSEKVDEQKAPEIKAEPEKKEPLIPTASDDKKGGVIRSQSPPVEKQSAKVSEPKPESAEPKPQASENVPEVKKQQFDARRTEKEKVPADKQAKKALESGQRKIQFVEPKSSAESAGRPFRISGFWSEMGIVDGQKVFEIIVYCNDRGEVTKVKAKELAKEGDFMKPTGYVREHAGSVSIKEVEEFFGLTAHRVTDTMKDNRKTIAVLK